MIGTENFADDFVEMWCGLSVGRILLQASAPIGQPRWYWGCAVNGLPQLPHHRGMAEDLTDAKKAFKWAWEDVRSRLTTMTSRELTRW